MAKPFDYVTVTSRLAWWFYGWCVIVAGSISASEGTSNDELSCRKYQAEQRCDQCMSSFYGQLDALPSQKFFIGVDVEVIRSVCSQLEESLLCLRAERESCPQTANYIESLVEPHQALSELCRYHLFYEEYAMSQSCISRDRVREQTETCWISFRRDTADLVPHIASGSPSLQSSGSSNVKSSDHRRRTALHHYCSKMRHLQQCVKTSVHRVCKKVAAGLVDVLVRASVKLSPYCTENVTSHVTTSSTSATAAAVAAIPGLSLRSSHTFDPTSGSVSVTSHSCCLLWTFVLTLLVTSGRWLTCQFTGLLLSGKQ